MLLSHGARYIVLSVLGIGCLRVCGCGCWGHTMRASRMVSHLPALSTLLQLTSIARTRTEVWGHGPGETWQVLNAMIGRGWCVPVRQISSSNAACGDVWVASSLFVVWHLCVFLAAAPIRQAGLRGCAAAGASAEIDSPILPSACFFLTVVSPGTC